MSRVSGLRAQPRRPRTQVRSLTPTYPPSLLPCGGAVLHQQASRDVGAADVGSVLHPGPRSSVDATTRTALDPRALTTRSHRRSTPGGHGSTTQHRSTPRRVNIGRSIGREDIGRHEPTLHSRAVPSLGVKGSWVRIPPSRQCEGFRRSQPRRPSILDDRHSRAAPWTPLLAGKAVMAGGMFAQVADVSNQHAAHPAVLEP
jgi:hypothetical protein